MTALDFKATQRSESRARSPPEERGTTLRRFIASLLTLFALVIAAPTGTAMASPIAHAAACVYGQIGGKTKCLRRGEFCARRYASQYRRYGFSCTRRDRNGRYHLT
jgi:hypothetical protein